MQDWLATTISVIAGGVLTMLAAWLGDRRLTERDREHRREERQERRINQRNDFQRETLLALQVASQNLARNVGASLHQDIIAHRNTGKWQRQQLPDNLSDDNLKMTTETMLLASRVHDEDVRALADQLRTQTVSVIHSESESEAERCMATAVETQSALIERIGKLIRELDEVD
jgi:hypothetical protein